MLALVVVLAVAAAFTLALSAMLEHREAHALRRSSGASLRTLRGFSRFISDLLRRRLWLIGWCANIVGFLIHATAIHLGTVALVQPFIATQIMFAMLLSSATSRRQPRRRDWAFTAALCAGLIVLLTVGHAAPLSGVPDRTRSWQILVLMAFWVLILIGVSRRCRPQAASFLLAVAAGTCFAGTAVLMKLTTSLLFDHGIVATATTWPGYTLALSTASGMLLEQAAFAAGSLPWSFAAMSVTNPLVSYVCGIYGFQVPIPHAPLDLLAIALSGALLIVGVTGLSHSPMARGEPATSSG